VPRTTTRVSAPTRPSPRPADCRIGRRTDRARGLPRRSDVRLAQGEMPRQQPLRHHGIFRSPDRSPRTAARCGGDAGRARLRRTGALRADPAGRGGVVLTEPPLVAEVKFFGRYKGRAIRDGVLLSVEGMPASRLRVARLSPYPAAMTLGNAAAADRLMQGMRPPGRAGCRRDGRPLRGRDHRSRVARAAHLFPMRQPQRRHGGDRDRAAVGLSKGRTLSVRAEVRATRVRNGWKPVLRRCAFKRRGCAAVLRTMTIEPRHR
jgi:hypothetical protein